MLYKENHPMPEWAQRERNNDLAWISDNLYVFWPAAQQAYKELGRGAIVVDTTSRPTPQGHPFGYVSQEGIGEMEDADALRMVSAYDPSWELVTMLLKQQGRVSTYRVGVPSARK